MDENILPVRLLSLSFPPWVLSSLKSGAFSPTSMALAEKLGNSRKIKNKKELKSVVVIDFTATS